MMVTMMRMMEVATTTLIITIVGSEEGAAISVTLPIVASVVIVVTFSVGVVFTVLFIVVGVGELAVVELVVSVVMMVSGGQVEPLA